MVRRCPDYGQTGRIVYSKLECESFERSETLIVVHCEYRVIAAVVAKSEESVGRVGPECHYTGCLCLLNCGENDFSLFIAYKTAVTAVGVKSEHGYFRVIDAEILLQRAFYGFQLLYKHFLVESFGHFAKRDMLCGHCNFQLVCNHKHHDLVDVEFFLQEFRMPREAEAFGVHCFLVERCSDEYVDFAVLCIFNRTFQSLHRAFCGFRSGLSGLYIHVLRQAVYDIHHFRLDIIYGINYVGVDLFDVVYGFLVETEQFGGAVDYRSAHLQHTLVGECLDYDFVAYSVAVTLGDAYYDFSIHCITVICAKIAIFVIFASMDIQYLKGVGAKRAALLGSELGIATIDDLIHFFPTRYIDRSTIVRIADIVPDAAYVQIRGRVVSREEKPKRLSVWVEDGSGRMELVFFKGIKYVSAKLQPGAEFIFFGKPSVFNSTVNIVHPEIDAPSDEGRSGSMTGVYPSTEKLKNAGVTGKVMNKIMEAALNSALPQMQETLPDYVIKGRKLVPIQFALRNIHFPQSAEALVKAQRRLKFEELFLLQLSLLKAKFVRMRSSNGLKMTAVGQAFNDCYKALPYELTGAQKRVIKEIRTDMQSGRQMNRLLQGDVGSGKTMVAVLSSLIACGNGYQACIMAPTEVLAQQHFRNISRYLEPTGVSCTLLTGSTKAAERRAIHEGLENGSIGIIVGTHALIEDDVRFNNLGFVVIDEQHRFGVDQRARLWQKRTDGFVPHVLVMTATPIPRTLAMTLYGDLDVSVLDEMPPGRTPIKTIHCYEGKRPSVFKFLKEQIAVGRQIFVVYPLIFESEKMDYKNLEMGYEQIVSAFPFPPYRTAIVHGQQSVQDKTFNMDAFVAGRADIMVATSVIEVGVDVPNASVMVIESAERFGLAQLHQLRGRVGRGSEQSYCILMTDFKLSRESKRRIELMCATDNGFVLAEEDMKLRGPGDLEGTQQSGLPIDLHIASIARDGVILSEARDYASRILERDPQLSNPANELLLAALRSGKYTQCDYSVIS